MHDRRTGGAHRVLGAVTGSMVLWSVAGCGGHEGPSPPPTASVAIVPTAAERPLGSSDRRPSSAVTAATDEAAACRAPSRLLERAIDGRDGLALGRCPELRTGQESDSDRCGQGGAEPSVDWQRLDEAVLELDERTGDHVRALAARGRRLRRNPRAFGLIGDSMTVSGAFLRPFSAGRRGPVELSPDVERRLAISLPSRPAATIIDYYRGAQAQRVRGLWTDSFGAPRAAKVGARSPWALVGEAQGQSPLAILVDRQSPAVAVVVFGGNDAAYRIAAPEQIAATFEEDFGRVIDALERRGVVPILSTIARHGLAPGLPPCDVGPTTQSNWRLAVQTNAVNAAIIRLACRRRLPLVDLRHGLDGAPNHGLGPDGVHPSAYAGGAGVLTARGLQCGYNLRNYLTLRMLALVHDAIGGAPSTGRRPAALAKEPVPPPG